MATETGEKERKRGGREGGEKGRGWKQMEGNGLHLWLNAALVMHTQVFLEGRTCHQH